MRNAYIAAQARRMGLDPKAVLAIASHEGLSGGIGDGGHAFGPGQLNDAGGVLTGAPASHHTNQWAWSNAGIHFWLKGLANVAGGLTGEQAIRAITTRYERPADPGAEIRDALAQYGHVSGGGTMQTTGVQPVPGQPGVVSTGGKHFDTRQFKTQLATAMMQDATDRAQGVQPQTDMLSQIQAIRQAATTKVSNAAGPGGIDLPTAGSGIGGKAAAIAARQIGTPYVWGGESKSGFDCSGLIQFTYGKLGIQLPRTAAEQGRAGRGVSMGNLKAGDLLVENNGDHVVMYAGNGQVVAAPHTGTNVQYQPLSYFQSGYHARRIVG